MIALSLGLVTGIGYLVFEFNPCRGLPYPTVGGRSLAEHNHATLQIYVDNNRILVPYGVGEGDGPCPQPLHNHSDNPDVIHVESPTLPNYTLVQYFNVWAHTPGLGAPSPVIFNQTQLFSFRVGNGNELRVYVNGQRSLDLQNLIIEQHMTIVIVYGNSVTTTWTTYQGYSSAAWPYPNI